ncbi:hypothetical protein [Bizionia myxarmorum]|uniref:Uncharacterized protein n=1 Tax=Bizionia myxarmorum TaxID=291186 RepID=A0A5D0REP7_9FLAO|nr:hypothetical protein [Bizionia myxarmorum]TYB79489.1 hypothetical protein ES674_06935 [Bizionia myxarmorum]
MELLIYKREYDVADSVQNFMNFYYATNMKHLASDLLDKGLSPVQISDAVSAAIKVVNSSGIEAHKHFMPVFSGLNEGIVQDCKLSHLGYGLVLMNANSNLSVVSEFQVDVLRNYLKVDF